MAGQRITTGTTPALSLERSLETASKVQLNAIDALQTRLETLITRVEETLGALEKDQELIESFIAGEQKRVEDTTAQIEALIKLVYEYRAILQGMQEAA